MFMADGGHFDFYTLIVPGGTGFTAGLPAEPHEATFSNQPTAPGVPSPLEAVMHFWSIDFEPYLPM